MAEEVYERAVGIHCSVVRESAGAKVVGGVSDIKWASGAWVCLKGTILGSTRSRFC